MTAATMDRSTPTLSAAAPGRTAERPALLPDTAPGVRRHQKDSAPEHRLDLRGLDYYQRRQGMFAALRALQPDQALRLTSDRADDVCWLRYEVEARIPQRYCWSLPLETASAAEIVVRLP